MQFHRFRSLFHFSPPRFASSRITLAALLTVSFAAAQEPPAPPPRPAGAKPSAPAKPSFLISRPVPAAEMAERGQKLYVAQCGFCHGTNATGGTQGPDLVRSVIALRDDNGELIGPVIRKGVPDKGMPPFASMTDVQIREIAAFLRSRQQAAINRGQYKIQNVVTGDAAQGQAFFARNCAGCHSPAGDLKGIAARLDPVALQARFLYPVTRTFGRGPAVPAGKPTMVTVTAGTRVLKGRLEYVDSFSVSLRDEHGDYHSFALDVPNPPKVDIQDPLAGHEALLPKYTDADMHNVLTYLVTLK